MNSSFVFLDVNDEELVEDLARYISTLKKEEGENPAFASEILSLLSQNKTDEIVTKFASASAILVTAPSKELEGAFNMLICYLRKAKKENLHGLIQKILEPFLHDGLTGKVTHFLSVLGNLYSQLEVNNPARYDVYVAILKFATRQHRLQHVQAGFPQVDQWLAEWGVSEQKKRELYLLIRDILKGANELSQAHQYFIKYLQTYDQAPAAELAGLKETASKAIVEAVDIPDVFQVDQILDLKVVEQLKGDVAYKVLLIFANNGYKEYLEFYNGNKDAIQKAGLSHERNLVKIRLITLAILASEHTDAIPYRTVAQALEVNENEVETWVIDAIRVKLIEAKLDQQKKLIVASKTTFRVFGDPQWKLLKQRLDAWKGSVAEVLQVIQNAKIASSQNVATSVKGGN